MNQYPPAGPRYPPPYQAGQLAHHPQQQVLSSPNTPPMRYVNYQPNSHHPVQYGNVSTGASHFTSQGHVGQHMPYFHHHQPQSLPYQTPPPPPGVALPPHPSQHPSMEFSVSAVTYSAKTGPSSAAQTYNNQIYPAIDTDAAKTSTRSPAQTFAEQVQAAINADIAAKPLILPSSSQPQSPAPSQSAGANIGQAFAEQVQAALKADRPGEETAAPPSTPVLPLSNQPAQPRNTNIGEVFAAQVREKLMGTEDTRANDVCGNVDHMRVHAHPLSEQQIQSIERSLNSASKHKKERQLSERSSPSPSLPPEVNGPAWNCNVCSKMNQGAQINCTNCYAPKFNQQSKQEEKTSVSSPSKETRMDPEEMRDSLIKRFAEILKEKGPLKPTDSLILDVFMRLTATERTVVMDAGSIREFLIASPYVTMRGQKLEYVSPTDENIFSGEGQKAENPAASSPVSHTINGDVDTAPVTHENTSDSKYPTTKDSVSKDTVSKKHHDRETAVKSLLSVDSPEFNPAAGARKNSVSCSGDDTDQSSDAEHTVSRKVKLSPATPEFIPSSSRSDKSTPVSYTSHPVLTPEKSDVTVHPPPSHTDVPDKRLGLSECVTYRVCEDVGVNTDAIKPVCTAEIGVNTTRDLYRATCVSVGMNTVPVKAYGIGCQTRVAAGDVGTQTDDGHQNQDTQNQMPCKNGLLQALVTRLMHCDDSCNDLCLDKLEKCLETALNEIHFLRPSSADESNSTGDQYEASDESSGPDPPQRKLSKSSVRPTIRPSENFMRAMRDISSDSSKPSNFSTSHDYNNSSQPNKQQKPSNVSDLPTSVSKMDMSEKSASPAVEPHMPQKELRRLSASDVDGSCRKQSAIVNRSVSIGNSTSVNSTMNSRTARKPERRDSLYICPNCGDEYWREELLKAHIDSVHNSCQREKIPPSLQDHGKSHNVNESSCRRSKEIPHNNITVPEKTLINSEGYHQKPSVKATEDRAAAAATNDQHAPIATKGGDVGMTTEASPSISPGCASHTLSAPDAGVQQVVGLPPEAVQILVAQNMPLLHHIVMTLAQANPALMMNPQLLQLTAQQHMIALLTGQTAVNNSTTFNAAVETPKSDVHVSVTETANQENAAVISENTEHEAQVSSAKPRLSKPAKGSKFGPKKMKAESDPNNVKGELQAEDSRGDFNSSNVPEETSNMIKCAETADPVRNVPEVKNYGLPSTKQPPVRSFAIKAKSNSSLEVQMGSGETWEEEEDSYYSPPRQLAPFPSQTAMQGPSGACITGALSTGGSTFAVTGKQQVSRSDVTHMELEDMRSSNGGGIADLDLQAYDDTDDLPQVENQKLVKQLSSEYDDITTVTSSCAKLVQHLSNQFPHLSRSEIDEVIHMIRTQKGSLKGLTKITEEAERLLKSLRTPKFTKLGVKGEPVKPVPLQEPVKPKTKMSPAWEPSVVVTPPSFDFNAKAGGKLSECVICRDPVMPHRRDHMTLECGHIFHEQCIKRWFDTRERTCPSCPSHVLTPDEFPPLGN